MTRQPRPRGRHAHRRVRRARHGQPRDVAGLLVLLLVVVLAGATLATLLILMPIG